jgi:hypothetical protein
VQIVTIQEAGLDGFWLHRRLERHGTLSHIVEPSRASLSTDRRAAPAPACQDGSDRRRGPDPRPGCAASRGCVPWCTRPAPRRRTAGG